MQTKCSFSSYVHKEKYDTLIKVLAFIETTGIVLLQLIMTYLTISIDWIKKLISQWFVQHWSTKCIVFDVSFFFFKQIICQPNTYKEILSGFLHLYRASSSHWTWNYLHEQFCLMNPPQLPYISTTIFNWNILKAIMQPISIESSRDGDLQQRPV